MRGQTGKKYKRNPWAKKVTSSIKEVMVIRNGRPMKIMACRPYRTYDGKYLKTECVIGISDPREKKFK